MATLEFPKGVATVEVPFESVSNHIVIPVSVQGLPPVPGVLDTGAQGAVLFGDSIMTAMGLAPAGESQIRGVGGGGATIRGLLYSDVRFGIGALVMKNPVVVAMPDSVVRRSPRGHRLALGRGVFEHAVVEIDWDTQRIAFHDPAAWRYEGRGTVVPFTFDPAGRPLVKARVALAPDSAFDVTLVVDTGASHVLSLEPGTDPRIHPPAGAGHVRLGRGASGELYGSAGRAATFTFAGVTFRDLPVAFPDASLGMAASSARQGNLGSGLLRRFHVILDYPNRRMILEPGPHLDDRFKPYGG
jgi:hypothetical protein